eukprot:763758-Hanusia_phi.AAC.1
MVGAAEAVTLPTVQTFVSRWIQREERATALSILSTCFQVMKRTGQDRTGQDRTRQVRTGQDRTGQ